MHGVAGSPYQVIIKYQILGILRSHLSATIKPMIVGVDIGGTKTYLAVFAENGKLLKEVRFETPRNYDEFLTELTAEAAKLETSKAKAACVAVPGLLNRDQGIVLSLGNLPWKDKHIRHDTSKALGIANVTIENDSKLAGLSEARYVYGRYSKVLYLTLSTGIGGAYLVDGSLVPEIIDMEVGKMSLNHKGTLTIWEEFASGRAFFEQQGKKAVDIEDPKIWAEYAQDVGLGLGVLCATLPTEAVVFGGGLGQHAGRFKKFLSEYLDANLHPLIKKPEALLSTHYRSQSVVYGCYHYAKAHLA